MNLTLFALRSSGLELRVLDANINQDITKPDVVVADMMVGKEWSSRALMAIGPVDVPEKIRSIPIHKTEVDEEQWWNGVEIKKITVKHVYNCIKEKSIGNDIPH